MEQCCSANAIVDAVVLAWLRGVGGCRRTSLEMAEVHRSHPADGRETGGWDGWACLFLRWKGVGWMDGKGEVIIDDGKTKDRASFLSQNEPLF